MSGGWAYDDLSEIEVILAPCNYIHEEYGPMVFPSGAIGDTVSDECIANVDEQKEFMGPLEVMILINNEKLNLFEYGDDSIKREALLARTQTDQKNPNFIDFYLEGSLLQDETSYF